jgi:putative colanic acid biosynthesis acetyltransferase WcaF
MTDVLKNANARTQPSFTLKSRMARTVWNFAYVLLFRHSPRPLHEWRAFLLRLFGAKIGRHCHIYPRAKIWAPWNLVCGDFVGLGDDVNVYSQDKITIGSKSVLSQGSELVAGTHDYTNKNFPLITKPIKIGDEVWLCAECFINPGVKIGNGTVIGARSVVTHNMPAWMVCAGDPCKPIKKRVIKNAKR